MSRNRSAFARRKTHDPEQPADARRPDRPSPQSPRSVARRCRAGRRLALRRRGAGGGAVDTPLQGACPRLRPAAARRRRLRHAGADPLGRSGGGRGAGLRSGQPDGRRAGEAVRLQQRLSRPSSAAARQPDLRPLPAGGEPRVHQHRTDVSQPRDATARARPKPRSSWQPMAARWSRSCARAASGRSCRTASTRAACRATRRCRSPARRRGTRR